MNYLTQPNLSLEPILLLEGAAQSAIALSTPKPSSQEVVSALLDAEKTAKQNKERYDFEPMLGSWRLCFITGTKKARNRAGIVLGAGRYLPRWLKIQLFYTQITESDLLGKPWEAGRIENLVELGSLKLSLTGPVKFLAPKNILAFDFTRMKVQFLGFKLYEGYIRGGKVSEESFYAENVGKQAFFSYFLVRDKIIAARGKGGGLALWGRI